MIVFILGWAYSLFKWLLTLFAGVVTYYISSYVYARVKGDENYLHYGNFHLTTPSKQTKLKKLRGVRPIKNKIYRVQPGPISQVKSKSKEEPTREGWDKRINDLRKAAAVHKQVRTELQRLLRPEIALDQAANFVEKRVRELTNYDAKQPLNAGWGFPTGLNVNNIAAHWTPNPKEKRFILHSSDILKVDFGVHVNGNIIDCAFSCSFDPIHDKLMKCTKDAVDTAIKSCGVDVRLSEIGRRVSEVINSYDSVTYFGKEYDLKPVLNLGGHDMMPYRIHHSQYLPSWEAPHILYRMKEYDVFAVEVFVTTGSGQCSAMGPCSHFMIKDRPSLLVQKVLSGDATRLLTGIQKQYGTLPFCRKWLGEIGHTEHASSLAELVGSSLIYPYPPLIDKAEGCFTAQYEHTVALHPNKKEVLSRGDDF